MKKINLEGEFGWEISVNTVRPQLEAANGEDLDVFLASPGGSVFKGIHVYNLFRDYKRDYPESQNTLTIKGLAASMSSYLMMCPAFDMVIVEDNACFMMHNPYGAVFGDYREAAAYYKMLDGLTDMMAEAYAKKLKKPKSEIRKMLDEEHWAFGENIVKEGFADEVLKTDGDKNQDNAHAMLKMQIKELNAKLRDEEIKSEDMQQIAACLDTTAQKPAETAAGENKTEVKLMNLEQFLKENPAANDEYKVALAAERKAGKDEVQAQFDAYKGQMIEATNVMKSDEYPEQIKNGAIEVIQGKKDMAYLNALVANADMIKEMLKSEAAKTETQNSDVPKTDKIESKLSEDGQIKSLDDYNASIAVAKNESGVEVM